MELGFLGFFRFLCCRDRNSASAFALRLCKAEPLYLKWRGFGPQIRKIRVLSGKYSETEQLRHHP
jgi:hypothetical protein